MTAKVHSPADLVALADKATKDFSGQFPELESAVGMLFTGRLVGWKILYLIHNKRTIEKYEQILGIQVREYFPAVGRLAHKSIAWNLMRNVGNFWKAVKGEIAGIRTPEIV
jgi:hypothetical protein